MKEKIDFKCELCGKYCATKRKKGRLFVELPPELQEKLDKSHAWLCFRCVMENCEETLGIIRYDSKFNPIRDKNGKIIRSKYWYRIIFGEKAEQERFKTA